MSELSNPTARRLALSRRHFLRLALSLAAGLPLAASAAWPPAAVGLGGRRQPPGPLAPIDLAAVRRPAPWAG